MTAAECYWCGDHLNVEEIYVCDGCEEVFCIHHIEPWDHQCPGDAEQEEE